MKESAANNKRIAKNTMLLYVRMMLIMVVQLYTSRVVLNTLGIVDYGLYNVVGGIVTMFAFLDGAMISSTQRYLTFELGTGNVSRIQQVFTTSVQIHAIISFIVLVLCETVGLWFFYHKMVIPEDRMVAAMWVLQLSMLAMIVQIMSTPYNAIIIAHERMGIYAVISIVEVVLKLVIVYLLLIGNFDKLILYAILILSVQLLVRGIYTTYCRRHFPESKLIRIFDKSLIREMSNFAGWNLMGNFAAVMYDTGLNMLLNMFFGPAVNAARAISIQVEAAIHRFASNFQTAVNPQITKLYAQGDREEHHKLIFRSSKFTFFLLLILMLPVAVEAGPILTLWLKIVPEHTIIFMRLLFCITIVNAVANPLTISAAATGNIKAYQITLSLILLTIVPISWLVLKIGAQPYAVFVTMLAVCSVTFFVRLLFMRKMIALSIGRYAMSVLLPCLGVGVAAVILSLCWRWLIPSGTWSWVFVCMLSVLSTFAIITLCGLSTSERMFIVNAVKKKIAKKSNKDA